MQLWELDSNDTFIFKVSPKYVHRLIDLELDSASRVIGAKTIEIAAILPNGVRIAANRKLENANIHADVTKVTLETTIKTIE